MSVCVIDIVWLNLNLDKCSAFSKLYSPPAPDVLRAVSHLGVKDGGNNVLIHERTVLFILFLYFESVDLHSVHT